MNAVEMQDRFRNTTHRMVSLDTETTGLYPAMGDRIVEIGGVEYVDRRPTGRTYHVYINPERDVPAEVVAIHGLDNARLRDEPKFAEIAAGFLAFCKGAELVIHNAPFDLSFINMELARAAMPALDVPAIIDTLTYSKREGVAKTHSLNAMCDRFRINRKNRVLHGALVDAELLGEAYINLTRGQGALSMSFDDEEESGEGGEVTRLSGQPVVVQDVDEDEALAHGAYMAQMMKENGGKCAWRTAAGQPAAAL